MQADKNTQIMIKAPDQVGELAKILTIVGDAGVNILAWAGYVQNGNGFVMLVTEDNAKIISLLRDAGYSISEQPVVVVREKDTVGRGRDIAKRVAEAGINVTQAYATAAGGEYITVFEAADIDGVLHALQ